MAPKSKIWLYLLIFNDEYLNINIFEILVSLTKFSTILSNMNKNVSIGIHLTCRVAKFLCVSLSQIRDGSYKIHHIPLFPVEGYKDSV